MVKFSMKNSSTIYMQVYTATYLVPTVPCNNSADQRINP